MVVRLTPWAIDGNTHPAAEARAAMASLMGGTLGLWTTSTTATDGGHGVVGDADFQVTANGTPNMSVNVALGSAFVRNGQSQLRETYHVFNDATVNLAIAAADATNARRDLIVVQVRDSNFSGANDDARLFVVQGTPAASPADPSLAATPNALVLARIQVNAADTSIVAGDITDLRVRPFVPSSLRCRLAPGTIAALPNATHGKVTFPTEVYDTGGLHDPAVNPTRITIPATRGGLWRFDYTVGFVAFGPGDRQASVRINGAGDYALNLVGHSTATLFVFLSGSAEIVCAGGDYAEVNVFQSSGGAMNIGSCVFTASYVGP